MSWVRLDDGYHDHPKTIAAGPLAGHLHACAMTWCSRHETDGIISAEAARSLARQQGVPVKAIATLVDVGKWDACEGGYHLRNFLSYNPSHERREQQRKDTAERVRGWRDGRRSNAAVTPLQTRCNTVGNVVGNAAPVPDPTPVPVVNPPSPTGTSPLADDSPVRRVLAAWESQSGRPAMQPDLAVVEQRIGEGWDAELLADACRGWVHDDWPKRRHHNGIPRLLKDSETIARFADLWRNGAPQPVEPPRPENPIDRDVRLLRERRRAAMPMIVEALA